MTPCPDHDRISAFVAGDIHSAEAIAQMEQHLHQCADCLSAVESLSVDHNQFLLSVRQSVLQESSKKTPYENENGMVAAIRAVEAIPVPTHFSEDDDTLRPRTTAGGVPSHSDVAERGQEIGFPHSQELPFEALGEYQLIRKLGEGGMGAVYEALHQRLEKIVALKILPPRTFTDPAAVERFEREIRMIGKLDHPNIVRALDAGRIGDIHYLAMELIIGDDKDPGARPASAHELMTRLEPFCVGHDLPKLLDCNADKVDSHESPGSGVASHLWRPPSAQTPLLTRVRQNPAAAIGLASIVAIGLYFAWNSISHDRLAEKDATREMIPDAPNNSRTIDTTTGSLSKPTDILASPDWEWTQPRLLPPEINHGIKYGFLCGSGRELLLTYNRKTWLVLRPRIFVHGRQRSPCYYLKSRIRPSRHRFFRLMSGICILR